MQSKRPLTLLIAAFAVVFGFLTIATPVFAADAEKVLYSFCSVGANCTDGQTPQASLIFDKAGNLYGTTFDGGAYSLGSVFELVRGSGGTWTEKVLYSFCAATNCDDGTNPEGLVFGADGKLYGIAQTGGGDGFGAVFQLTPRKAGTWSYKVLHNFDFNDGDGYYPFTGLIVDAAGNLYGVTDWGGAYNSGTVFELTAGAKGKWTEKKLHSFNDNGKVLAIVSRNTETIAALQAAKLEAERSAENYRERLSQVITRAVARNQTAATRKPHAPKKAKNPRKLKRPARAQKRVARRPKKRSRR